MSLAVLVPWRDDPSGERGVQLAAFRLHMSRVLPPASVVIVAEQIDAGVRFNRGALLNAASVVALRRGATHAVHHDVDLLPDARFAHAFYHPHFEAPTHLAAAFPGRYAQDRRYAGGVLAVPLPLFCAVNGYPNSFFGWGGEDEVLRERLAACGTPIARDEPHAWARTSRAPAYIDLEGLSLQDKLRALRESDAKMPDKRERCAQWRRDHWRDGLSSLARDLTWRTVRRHACYEHVRVSFLHPPADSPDDDVRIRDASAASTKATSAARAVR